MTLQTLIHVLFFVYDSEREHSAQEMKHVHKSVQDQGHRGGSYWFYTFDPSQNILFFQIPCFFFLTCKAVFGWWQLWEFWNPACTMGTFSDFCCLVIHLEQHMESE